MVSTVPERLRRHRLKVSEYLRMGEAGILPTDARVELIEPDIALLRPREDFYTTVHPGPEDVLLVIEVADTTLCDDREVKGLMPESPADGSDKAPVYLHSYRR
jgi:Putative restriction endonuclease